MDQVKFFKGCLPQILLGLFLNTLSHLTKYYTIQKGFCLKFFFFMFLAKFIFVVSHLKKHPAVHLNTSKDLTSL